MSLKRRMVKHGVFVGVSLATIGFILAHAFLMAHRVFSGGAYNPENERVLWQTPVVMAGLGIAMSVALDLLAAAFRRPVPVPATPPPPAGPDQPRTPV